MGKALQWPAFDIVTRFESAVAEYAEAPYVVACDSCTNALFLSLLYLADYPEMHRPKFGSHLSLPARTYIGVAQAVLNAGYDISEWRDEDWEGQYRLEPLPLWDAAKRFTRGMFSPLRDVHDVPFRMQCVSFHIGKHLKIGRGGAILTDSADAARWLRRVRFDGRDPDQEDTGMRGFHMYLTPPDAARGLWLLSWLPERNEDLRNEHVNISGYGMFRS